TPRTGTALRTGARRTAPGRWPPQAAHGLPRRGGLWGCPAVGRTAVGGARSRATGWRRPSAAPSARRTTPPTVRSRTARAGRRARARGSRAAPQPAARCPPAANPRLASSAIRPSPSRRLLPRLPSGELLLLQFDPLSLEILGQAPFRRASASPPLVARSHPLGAFLRLRPLRHEVRLVALVEEDHAMQVVVLQLGPAPARAGVHLVHAFPGPLGGRLPAPLGDAVVDVAAGQAEPQLAQLDGHELDERRAFLFHVVHVPFVHRNDTPPTCE